MLDDEGCVVDVLVVVVVVEVVVGSVGSSPFCHASIIESMFTVARSTNTGWYSIPYSWGYHSFNTLILFSTFEVLLA